MINKQNSNSDKIKIINKWSNYTNNFELLLFDDDILTLIIAIDEIIPSFRKGHEGDKLLDLYIGLVKKADEKINKNFIDFYNSTISKKAKKLLIKNKKKNHPIIFKKYKKKETIIKNLQEIICLYKDIFNPKNILNFIRNNFEDNTILEIYLRYYLKSLIYFNEHKPKKLDDRLYKNIIKNTFSKVTNDIKNILNANREKVNQGYLDIINKIIENIKSTENFEFKKFKEVLEGGHGDLNKNYYVKIIKFLFKDQINLNKESIEQEYKKVLSEFILRTLFILISSPLLFNSKNAKNDFQLLYKEFTDNLFNIVEKNLNFTQDYESIIDFKKLGGVVKGGKEKLRQHIQAKRRIKDTIYHNFWYRICVFASEGLNTDFLHLLNSSTSLIMNIEQKNLERLYKIYNFDELRELPNKIQDDFNSCIAYIKSKSTLENLQKANIEILTNYFIESISNNIGIDFTKNIDFDHFDKKTFKNIIINSLRELIEKQKNYYVYTNISNIDLGGKVIKIPKNIYLYDSRSWDFGEANYLDFFNPIDFKSKKKEYADMQFINELYFLALSHTWGKNINPTRKVVRHSCRAFLKVKAFNWNHAIRISKQRLNKIKYLLPFSWALQTGGKQDYEIDIANIFLCRTTNFNDFHLNNFETSHIFKEEFITLKSITYKEFNKYFKYLLEEKKENIDSNILDSISYWQEGLFEFSEEKRFLMFYKALESLMGGEIFTKSGKKLLMLISDIYSNDYMQNLIKELRPTILKIRKNENSRKIFYKIISKNYYYYEVFEKLDLLINGFKSTEFEKSLIRIKSKYSKNDLENEIENDRSKTLKEIRFLQIKRNSIIHHNRFNIPRDDLFPYYNKIMDQWYHSIIIKTLNARLTKTLKVEKIEDVINVLNINKV